MELKFPFKSQNLFLALFKDADIWIKIQPLKSGIIRYMCCTLVFVVGKSFFLLSIHISLFIILSAKFSESFSREVSSQLQLLQSTGVNWSYWDTVQQDVCDQIIAV